MKKILSTLFIAIVAMTANARQFDYKICTYADDIAEMATIIPAHLPKNTKVVDYDCFNKMQQGFSFTLAFTTQTTNSMTMFVNVTGNTDPTSQVGIYFGLASKSTFDSVRYAVIPVGNCQLAFTFTNLTSGTAYDFRLYGWNSTIGIAFDPPNGAHTASTIFVAQSSVYALSMTCVSTTDIYVSYTNNDPNALMYASIAPDSADSPAKRFTPVIVAGVGSNLMYQFKISELLHMDPVPGKTNYVKIYIRNSAYTDSSLILSCNTPLGIKESVEEIVGVKVFPNPTAGISEIICPGNTRGKLMLYNMTGELVKEFEVANGKGQIETYELASGLYSFQVLDNEGQLVGKSGQRLSVVK